jgi:hypothetical protein
MTPIFARVQAVRETPVHVKRATATSSIERWASFRPPLDHARHLHGGRAANKSIRQTLRHLVGTWGGCGERRSHARRRHVHGWIDLLFDRGSRDGLRGQETAHVPGEGEGRPGQRTGEQQTAGLRKGPQGEQCQGPRKSRLLGRPRRLSQAPLLLYCPLRTALRRVMGRRESGAIEAARTLRSHPGRNSVGGEGKELEAWVSSAPYWSWSSC